MKKRLFPFALAVTLSISAAGLASAQQNAGAGAKEQLGAVVFPNSCSEAVQEKFLQGVAMLHSFWYSAGQRTFGEVLAQDPSCAIATWGIAAILMSNPLAGSGASPKGVEVARAAIEQGRRIGAKTQRERDYIEAVAEYYAVSAVRSERERQVARAKAFESLANRYPEDDEAQVFSALYTAATQLQSDQTYSNYLRAAGILEAQFAKHPEHPGVAHYLIHSYDAPPIAAKGLPAARRYASIAPSAAHALHMPSHIFTRVGAWEESAATNRRSAESARKGNEPDESYHASDYRVYAYLQLARDADARRVLEVAVKTTGTNPARFTAPYAVAAMRARCVVERGAWGEAIELQPQATRYPFTEAITYFARALGAARSGNAAAAEKEVEQITALRQVLRVAKNNYWAREVEVQRLAATAWIALAQNKPADALEQMRAAAELEDKSEKHIVTPGRILPARELLGDMLLQVGQSAQALKEYEASAQREPNRFRGIYGAGQAAEQSGDPAKARQYYARLVSMAGKGDSRPELERARAYLESK